MRWTTKDIRSMIDAMGGMEENDGAFQDLIRWVEEGELPSKVEKAARRFIEDELRRREELRRGQQQTAEQAARSAELEVALRSAIAAESQADTAKRALEMAGRANFIAFCAVVLALLALFAQVLDRR